MIHKLLCQQNQPKPVHSVLAQMEHFITYIQHSFNFKANEGKKIPTVALLLCMVNHISIACFKISANRTLPSFDPLYFYASGFNRSIISWEMNIRQKHIKQLKRDTLILLSSQIHGIDKSS